MADAGEAGGVEVAQEAPRLVLTGAVAELHRAGAGAVTLPRIDAALLAVLASEGPTTRQRLVDLLWPEQSAAAARNALRQRLFRLRRAAGVELIQGSETLLLAPGTRHDLDDGEAADNHDLLGGFSFDDWPGFAAWLDARRTARSTARRARDIERLAACERDGRSAEGVAIAERLLAGDALDETVVQRLMTLHYLDGRRAAALQAYERFALALGEDGGVPSPRTTTLLATLRAAQAPPLAALPVIPVSVLRPPRLIGRDAERRALQAAWATGQAFWLLGEAGLGKTRLIAEAVGDAPSVLVTAARPGDAGVPYATLGRVLRALLARRTLPPEAAQRAELVRLVPEVGGAAPAGLGRQLALQAAIEALLGDARRDGLAAIVVDDLHFADPASLEMLQALVPGEGAPALCWGFAQRPAEGGGAAEALRAAFEEAQAVLAVALGPLDAAQMAELIASLDVPGLDAAVLAPQITRHTGGNPMYALETIKSLIVAGPASATGGALPRPASVGQLIERRLRRLTPQALALARVAAVAGVDFSIDLAEAVLGERALALADAWRELEAAQVLREQAFAHDLVYEATLAGLPATIAAHTHGAVAAFLEARGGAPARVAAHWLAAGQPPRALAALHAAADAARQAMRRKEEATFLARAAQIEHEAGAADAAFASWRAMIDAAWAADLNSLEPAMFDRLETLATAPAQRADALALRASWAQERGELADARRLARAAIELADASGAERVAFDARHRLAEMADYDGDHEAALALLQPLLPWAAERAQSLERAEFYCRYAIVLDNTERGRDARTYHQRAIEAAREAQAWDGVVTVLGNLAVSWETAGYMQRAIDALREAQRLAAAHDEARGCGASLPAELLNALRDRGHYGEALGWVDAALAAEPGARTATIRCNLACCWVHLGQHARALRELDRAGQETLPGWMRARLLQVRARAALAAGQPAGTWLDEARALMQSQHGRRGLRLMIELDHALRLPPDAALAVARLAIAEAERLDLPGGALAGHVRAARFAAAAGRRADAAAHAEAVLASADDLSPGDLYGAERWLSAWLALQCAGHDARAAEVLRLGVAWVQATRRDHVPEPFRDSFVRANPVNLELLRAARAS